MSDSYLPKSVFIPFSGSKSKHYTKIKDIIINLINKNELSEFKIIYDIFGGSGALSLMFHEFYPNAKIIYNDYDEIIETKKNENVIDKSINRFNIYRREITNDFEKANIKQDEKLPSKLVEYYKNKYKKWIDNDWYFMYLFNSSISFNGRSADVKINDSWNKVRKTDIEPKHYLYEPFKITHLNYVEIFNKLTKTKPDKKTLLLLDPPYLNTDWTFYKTDWFNFWEYIKMLKYFMDCLKLGYYLILFESTASQIDLVIEILNPELFKNLKIKKYELSQKEIMMIIEP